MRDAGEDFSDFCWSFTGGKPLQNAWSEVGQVPAKTALAEEVAAALKARGFKFVGPVIVYAWMQAVGIVNDHLTCCFRHDAVKG
jgi:DNA-3-methyladenine glycosylase I